MKCYYRLHEEWIKGHIMSMNGGRGAYVMAEDDRTNQMTLHNVEIIFGERWACVTGYEEVTSHPNEVTFKLTSLDVIGGWGVKPK